MDSYLFDANAYTRILVTLRLQIREYWPKLLSPPHSRSTQQKLGEIYKYAGSRTTKQRPKHTIIVMTGMSCDFSILTASFRPSAGEEGVTRLPRLLECPLCSVISKRRPTNIIHQIVHFESCTYTTCGVLMSMQNRNSDRAVITLKVSTVSTKHRNISSEWISNSFTGSSTHHARYLSFATMSNTHSAAQLKHYVVRKGAHASIGSLSSLYWIW